MGSKIKGKTTKRRTLWLSLGAAFCGVAIALTSLFGVNSMNANAMYNEDVPADTDVIKLLAADNQNFDGAKLQAAYAQCIRCIL